MKDRTTPILLTTVAALGLMAGAAQAQVHVGATSIEGSLCVGNDCVASEAFGFDTIRIKENNLRIHANDTSTAASFPSTDWRLIFNDSANGGTNKFSLEDASGGRVPFTVVAGARTNALYVDGQGDVGIGTSTPATDIEIKIGDSPTLRLQQDGSSGFQPQTWDVAGNEANFFVRDASNGSTLPLRIRPSAPTDSIEVEATGAVNIGQSLKVGDVSTTHEYELEVVGDTDNARFAMRSLEPGDEGNAMIFNRKNSEMRISDAGDNIIEFKLTDDGDLTITGTLTTGGTTCGGGCDAVFANPDALPSIEDHAARMWANGYLPNVGPTLENTPINISDKLGRMLNELEHAHIFIDRLNREVAEIPALRAKAAEVDALKARLAALEARLAD